MLATLTCTRSDSLPAGDSYPPITLTVDVANNAASPQVNLAKVEGGGDPTPSTDEDPTVILTDVNLNINKSHQGNFTQGQTGAEYTIEVSNAGPSDSTGTVTVTDTLPAGLTATAINGPGWNCVLATLTCTRSDSLPAGDSYPPITLTVDVANNAASPQVNLAKVEGGGDPTPSTDEDPTVILTDVNLNINKSHQGNFTQGQTGAEYTIEVSNAGPSDSTGTVTVTDTLPAGLTATAINGPGWNCVLATLTCTRSDSLPAGDSYPPITLTVDVANNAASPQVNLAKVEGGGDPTPSTDEDPTVILTDVNLNINKSHQGNFTQGQTGAEYTIEVSNAGPSDSTGTVTVTDTLPAGLTATAINGPGWNCVLATLTCTRSDSLPAGDSYPPITLTVDVANNAASPQVNLAKVEGGGDPTPSTDEDPTVILTDVNLNINKSHQGNFTQGQTGAEYTIEVSNAGPSDSTGTVTVTDTLPAGLTATAINGPGWNCVLATLTCTRSDSLPAGDSYPPITLTVDVANNAASPQVNLAKVEGGGDPTPSTDEDPTVILTDVNLNINKSHQGNFTQGQTGAEYTIEVSNAGPSDSTGTVTVTDTLPAGLTATAINGPGWNCVLATLTCTRSDSLPAGDSYPPITLTVDVANNAASPQVNLAKVEGGGDPTPSTDEDPTVILTDVNLNINKSHQGNFTQGQTGAEYTIEVSNAGPSDSTGTVTVTDTLPAGLTATAINGPGWNCVLATLTCTRSDSLPAGDSYPPITLTVDVANNAASPQVNLAKVEGGGDPTPSTDEDPTVILTDVNLNINKSHQGNFTQGQTGAEYTIEVSNAGPSDSTGTVTVTDTLPAGLTATAINGPGWNCVLATLTCTRSDSLPAGDSYPPITLTVDVANNAASPQVNLAKVEGGGDPTPSTDEDPTVILTDVNLNINKSHQGNFTQGQTGAEYTIEVSNAGPSDSTGTVTVTDTLPAGLTATAINGPGWNCVLATLTCTRSDSLPAGDSYPPITLTVDVANNASSPQVNLAKVEGGGDPTPSTDEDPTVILTDVNLNINKSHQGNFTQGQTGAEYTIEVSNAGPSDSTGTVTVTDTLPAGLTATAINGPGWNCVLATLTCTRSDSLPAGDSYPPITLTVDVANNAASPQVNLAKVEGGGDPTPSTDEDPTTIIQQAVDVQITKTASPLVAAPGDTVTYTLTAKNNGPGTALNVVMTDPLPAGVTFDSADAPCALSGVTVSCAVGPLDPGEEITRQIRVKVEPIAAPVAEHDHLLDIQRVEAQIDLEAGQQRTIAVNCPSGYFVSDGSVRIDHIDQGTGDWTAPQVLESRSTSLGTWQGTVRNTATGRAQAKIFAVCIKRRPTRLTAIPTI